MKTILPRSLNLFTFAVLLLLNFTAAAQTETFTTPGNSTFNVPNGVGTISVQAYGGGGKGGTRSSTFVTGGGGGGAFARRTNTAVTSSTYTVTVGDGGDTASPAGGDSGVVNDALGTTVVLAKGGAGVNNNVTSGGNGGSAAASVGELGGVFSGGNGASGTPNNTNGNSGGGGASGNTLGAGNSGTSTNGGNGANGGGRGGNGVSSNNGDGDDGTIPGGGGGGAFRQSGSTRNGGSGARGQVTITYTCPTYALTSAPTSNAPRCITDSNVTVTLRSTSIPLGSYEITYNMTGATPATGLTATVTFVAGSPRTATFTTPALNSGSTNIFVTSIRSYGCTSAVSSFNSLTVNVYAAPTSNAGTAVTACANATSINIGTGASASNALSVLWTSSGTGTVNNATLINAATYTPSPADIAAGSVTLTLTANGYGSCTASASKTLTLTGMPVAVAGNAVTACPVAPVVNITSGASASNASSVQWSISGTGTLSNSNSLTSCTYTPNAADIAAGSFTITLTANATFPCTGSVTSTKTFTFTGSPTGYAGPDMTRCASDTNINITGGATATNYSNVAWVSSGSGTLNAPNSLTNATYTPSPADIAAGSVTLTLNVNRANCASASSSKILTLTPAPTAVAGPTLNICSFTGTSNITTGASASNYTSVSWSTSGLGTLSNANSLTGATYTPVALDLIAGSVTVTLTVNGNAPCGSVTSTKTINFSQNPTAVAGGNMTICSSAAGVTNITGGASATNYTTTVWSSSGSGVLANAGSLTNATYNPSAADLAAGSVTLTLTANSTYCGQAVSTKTFTFVPAATAVAGPVMNACFTGAAINITAGSSASNYAALQWSSNGTGTISNASSLTNATYLPSAADIAAGSVTLTLTATANTPCANAVSTKTLNLSELATVDAGTAVATCAGSGAVNITAGATASNATTLLWTSSGTGTFANANSLTNATYNPSAADVAAGSVVLTLTGSNVGCGNDTSTKTLTIYAMPSVTGTVPATRTGPGTLILGASASGGTLNWYAAASGGSPLGFGSSFTTPYITTTTTYYVAVSNPGCTTPTRVAVTATVIYPEIDVRGNATSIASGDMTPSATDWTDFGATNMTRVFTITNSDTGVLSLGAITISGAAAGDFAITANPSGTVANGSSTTFTVTFTPTAAGVRSAVINIPNNDSNENPYTFAIQGTGVAREIDIQGNATTIVDGDTTPSTADWTDFGSAVATRTFTIRNLGNIALNIGAITMSGTNASDFVVTTPPAATLGAYATTTFTVTFSPSAINDRYATISIVNDDSNENPYDFALHGFGIIPEIDIRGNGNSIVTGDTTPSTTDWTSFGSATVTRTFTVYNQGNTNLTLGSVILSGVNASEFTVTQQPASVVTAFGTTTFTIVFSPTAVGNRDASISLSNNDTTGGENPYTFSIRGVGVAQEINIQGLGQNIADGDTTPSLTDGTNFSDVALTRTFTIFNLGNMPLVLSGTSFTGTNASEFSVTTAPVSPVPAFGSTTVTITFTPAGIGARYATFRLGNNDADENPYDFAIQGTGGIPEINIRSQFYVNIADGDTTPSPSDQTDFGQVSMDGATVIANFVIQNTGTGALSIGAATFTGTNASNFAVVMAPASTIAAGGSSRFQIAFTPTTIGQKYATFNLVNGDADENPYNFDLTGLGVQTYKDTDGDGITDNKDLDDDNDGIIDIKEQTDGLAFPLTSLVEYVFLNETFGAGTTKGPININTPGATSTYCYEDGYGSPCDASPTLEDGEYCVNYKITGAVGSDPENIHGDLAWYDGLDHTPDDVNGRMAVFNASFAAGTFYETRIDGVIPNVPISYSFHVLNIMRQGNYGGSIRPNITVEFVDLNNNLLSSFNTGFIGRCVVGDPNNNDCAQGQWLPYSVSVNLGNVSSFVIRFKNNSTGGGGNDLAIDDIKIVQNYIDTDGDGIANIFDLDDENDGIPDVEEAGFRILSNGKSTIDLSSSATWQDVNRNGLHDSIDALIAAGTYMIADTDGDGVPNYLDLDSDNDSLFDVDEAGMYNGDGDINGDGRGDLADTDRDGILDLYDNNTGFGTNFRPAAQDTDGNGIGDYLQLDSDGDGIWDIQTGLYGSLDTNNDGKIDGNTDIDKDGILDNFDTNTSVTGSPRDLNRKLYLEFDGRNDFGQGTTLLGGRAALSMMAWVDLAPGYNANGVVIGQDNCYIRINAARQLQAVLNGSTYTCPTVMANSQWYHVGMTLGSGLLKLYLNGQLMGTWSESGVVNASDVTLLTMGRHASTPTQFFKGKIDEVRIFNVALTDQFYQRMVYQEIQSVSAQVRGEIIPKNVGINWSTLLRYYRMDAYKDDIVDDLTTLSIDVSTGMRIYNNKYIRVQEAPMPFLTERAGNFATAVHNPLKDIRGLDIMDQDWSIVSVRHNITETANNVDLGMFVAPNVTITMNNDTKIQNDWYLRLNGKIDLQGKSQLVQTTLSDLDYQSAGSIERDQQGQSNKFNYNYWCSPVGVTNTTSNNNNYTVNGIMRDATNPANLQNINWVSGYDGAPTSPISLSNYWIFKFQNTSPVYANWTSVGPNGTLLAGQGFTLKGSGAVTPTQNMSFTGKPHNGDITSAIAANNLNLTGNPYASALDANAFIAANSAATTGTLYFWEHYSTNNTHVLANYQGGYATRNLVGGTPPVSPAGVSGLGSSTRVPGRFIPVGQGFFVSGSATGGTVTFRNAQRTFVKETDVESNFMFRLDNQAGPRAMSTDPAFNNAQDPYENDSFARVRLGFTSPEQYHRQTLLGFMDEFATAAIDPGYDAPHIDNQPSDMYFLNQGTKLVIEGEGYFNDMNRYAVGVKLAAAGNIRFELDGTENFDESQGIYIYDNVTDSYHTLRDQTYEVQLPAGNTDNRFYLTFRTNETLASETFAAAGEIGLMFTRGDRSIHINNNTLDTTVEKVMLFNMLGQEIMQWDTRNQAQKHIELPVKMTATGTYIVKAITSKGELSKKVILNQ